MVLPIAPALASGALSSVFKPKSSLDQLNDLYQRTVGRDIDKDGYDYWSEQLAGNKTTLSNIESLLKDSKEYKDRAATVKQYQDSGKGNPAESVLDALDSAYKGEFASPSVSKSKEPLVTISPSTGSTTPAVGPVFNSSSNTSKPKQTIPSNAEPLKITSIQSPTQPQSIEPPVVAPIDTKPLTTSEAAIANYQATNPNASPIVAPDTKPLTTSEAAIANYQATNPQASPTVTADTGEGDIQLPTEEELATGNYGLGLNDIFNQYLGRDVGEEGATYWNDEYSKLVNSGMDQATARQNIINSIKSGEEHSGRQGLVDYFNNRYGMNPSESFLDSYIGPGGESLRDLPTAQQAQAPAPTPAPTPAPVEESVQEQQPQESEFDQFIKFMTAIQGLGGMGGGMGNYGYGGYGGFTPGGVAAAAPMTNMMNFMNAFRNMRGTSSSPAVSTGNIGF